MSDDNVVDEAWKRAAEFRQQQKMESELDQMKKQGYDPCKLCGDEVPVYEDDDHEDVLQRLIDHAEARDDHIKDPQRGWILVGGTPERAGLAKLGERVFHRAFIVAIVVTVGHAAALYLVPEYRSILMTSFAIMAVALMGIGFAGAVVMWRFDDRDRLIE